MKKTAPPDDIAVIGMSCRVAGADSPSKLWELLASSKDVRKEIDRFNSGGYYRATGSSQKGLTNVRHAYLLEEGIDRFDNGFFATPAAEAEAMDPQQRLLLEIAYEAMENAGIPLERIQGTDTAVYAGLFTSDYGTSLLRDIDATPKYHSTGTSNSIAANRISYFFNLHGPSMVIDTACSSTLTALNQAVNGLKSGESEMALVCGANLILNPDMFVHMSELGFLSPDGRCKSFDASGDGYARGEGVLALLLKPLAQALRDNDPIRSVIKGTHVNQDGKTNGITMPSPEAQILNMQALYTTHGLDPGDVQYLEAHGTGTKVGDPLEMSAIDSIFGESHKEQPLIVGSVKSNVGHLEACAAIVGIVKTIECLERGKIPAQKHFKNPNPKVNFANKMIPQTLMDWPKTYGAVRRAAINSFGFGGTNGHAVLENFPLKSTTPRKVDRPFLFKVSAANELSLQHLSLAYADYIGTVRPALDHLAYTLLSRRSTLKKSLFITASSHEELVENLVSWSKGSSQVFTRGSLLTPSIGFVFTGQGAQWAEMGKQLFETSAIFARVIDVCEKELSLLKDGPHWSLRQELCKPARISQISIASFSQPLCTALQLGIVEMFKEWGIIPKAVLGHSSGEIGAAYTVGLLSLRDAIVTAYYRGLYMSSRNDGQKVQSRGAMCAVGLGEAATQSLLESYSGRVSLAAVNSPSSCTISGDKSPIDKIVEHCKERGIFCRALRVDTAYHSHHMLPLAPSYEASLRAAGVSSAASLSQQGCEMFSSVIQRKLAPKDCTAAYWVQNMVSTVRFTAALTEATRCHSLGALVEIGPHPALKGPALDTLAALGKSEIAYFPSCFRNKPDLISLLETTSSMLNAGFPVSTEAVNKVDLEDGKAVEPTRGPPLTDIPKYQWDHSASHWAESRISKNQRFRRFPRHTLLGARSSDDIPSSPTWRNLLRRREADWLDTMIHNGLASLPKSSYILMVLEAARQIRVSLKPNESTVVMSDVHFIDDLSLSNLRNDDDFIETRLSLWHDQKRQVYQFSVSAHPNGGEDDWHQYCTGSLSFASENTQESELPEISGNDSAILEYIQSLAIYPKTNLESLRLDSGRADGSFTNTIYDDDDEESYLINPAMFATLERLPDMLLSGSGLPAEYQLESIDLVRASLSQKPTPKVEFAVQAKRIGPIQGVGVLQVRDANECFLCLEGMSSKVIRTVERKHPLKSLFFKPDIRPDISFIKCSGELSLHETVELVTHKWPMADFGAADISEEDLDLLKSHLKGFRKHERPRFRSLSVLHREGFPSVDRLRAFKAFDSDQRFHFFLSTARDLSSRISCVRSDGFACIKVEGNDDRQLFERHLDPICKIQGLSGDLWLLGRPKQPQNGVAGPHKLVICVSEQCDITKLYKYGDFQLVRISQDMTATARSIQKHLPEVADIIIIDCAEESMLVDWSGSELLPWTQLVLERAQNLLWVSNQINSNPFAGLTGAFIRTIQSEYPSMKASSLVFKDSSFVPKTVFEVYDSMSHGNNELEILVQSGHVCALRYHPDDELSAAVGCIPPHKSDGGLGSSEYEIAMAEPGRAILLSTRQIGTVLSQDYVQVAVEVSLVDYEDLKIFMGKPLHGTEAIGLGQFFAGKVVSSRTHNLEPGHYVVGWQPGAHRSTIFAPFSQLSRVPDKMSLDRAVVQFAAYVVAFTIVCDIARARHTEIMNIRVAGVLAEALTHVCQLLEIGVLVNSQKDAGFVVDFDPVHGIQVNRRSFSPRSFFTVGEAHARLSRILWDQPLLESQHEVFELRDFQKAFQNAEAYPLSTVLGHNRSKGVPDDLLNYSPSEKLFRDDAAYIIVGGLGGLGRYTLKWMVSKGARHLVTLSRSGLDSTEAQQAFEEIEQLGAEITAFKVDASDESKVRDVLAKVREKRPIRGCINMVLVLDNSPFNTMTSQQWDKVISSKVRTTWNLHQATLCDSLDMFLMFSSVSSISGNRTQANYATGNAFQNAVAEFRKNQGLPGIAIALGAMRSIGVLAEDHALLRTLSQSGLIALGPEELCKVLEAAVIESQHADRHLLSTGFEMFESLDGVVQSRPDQTQLFWTEWPEFGFLLEHNFSTAEVTKTITLSEQIKTLSPEAAHDTLVHGFLICLGNVLGYDTANIDPSSSLASYGLDSLNAVSCRYWFFKELTLDVPIFDVLGCKSINELISRVLHKLDDKPGAVSAISLPKPVRHEQQTLTYRPISHSQSRLWFLHRFLPDKTVHNLLLVCHISGKINVPAFEESWSVFVRRHQILHSKIIDTESGLQQIPSETPQFELTLVDANEDSLESQVASLVEKARSWVFDLESGELVRGWLLQSRMGCRFFLASHHLAWDRASVPTIFDETTNIYKSLINGNPAEMGLAPPDYQFIDYTLWQNSWMAQPDIVKPHMDYWKAQLAGVPDAVSLLPTALLPQRPTQKRFEVDMAEMSLDSSITADLKEFCRNVAVTPFMFMASALTALLYRFTGDEDIVIGIADGDRGHTEFDRLVGFTVNMLAIRSKITGDSTFANLLEDYRKTCLEAYEHRGLPFDYLLQNLDIPRRTSHSPLFQVSINYQMQGAFPECDFGDFKFTDYDHYNARSQFDLMLDIEETKGGELHCALNFDTNIYDMPAMTSFANSFQVYIRNALKSKGEAQLDSMSLVSAEDRHFISSTLQPDFKQAPALQDLDLDLFPVLLNKAVARRPRKAAIIDDANILTYAEVDIATRRIARFLVDSGVQAGDRIGVCCEQGADMVLAMFGIVRAGCVYVPIDPDFPDERISSMIEDVDMYTVLVDRLGDKKYERLITCGILSSRLNLISKLCHSVEHTDLPLVEDFGQFPFCCIFTSGSTGRPKGIPIGHKQLRYQMEGYHSCINTTSDDKLLLSSAMVFDMSLPPLFGTILHGGTLVIASREARYSPAAMVDLLVEREVSNCTFTTTQLKMLLTAPNKGNLANWTSLRSMVVGGEAIPPWVVRDFFDLKLPNASIFNGYAPAETTVCNSLRRLAAEDALRSDVPLEKPTFPSRFHILDNHLNPIPIGLRGELYIGGPTVNEGYYKRKDLTAAAFLPDPFASVAEIEAGHGRLYRTKDLFRLLRDGSIMSVGRVGGDRQIKIRGMRTELNEIETAIYGACQAIEDEDMCRVTLSAVVYHVINDLDGVLAAYIEAPQSNEDQQQSFTSYLRLRLKSSLPVHMNPSAIIFVDSLPRTISEKIDYRKILTWPAPAPQAMTSSNQSTAGQPLTSLQADINTIWKSVLHIEQDLSPTDEFFALGGHSLNLIHVQEAIREKCNVTIQLGDMFANPTIEGMESLVTAEHLKSTKDVTNGIVTNGTHTPDSKVSRNLAEHGLIDWDKETSLPPEFDCYVQPRSKKSISSVAITGACTMAGAHFINHVLRSTELEIHCIGTEGADNQKARANVLSSLAHWRLNKDLSSQLLGRLIVFKGDLSHPTLGLNAQEVDRLDESVGAIFQLDSDVSLLKRYENLRDSNVGSLRFLIALARGKVNNTKPIHYLSTWAVPHLQAWTETQLSTSKWLTSEVEMANMAPSRDGSLGYLKARWACEALLYKAARRGIPVNIFRSCMCASSPRSGVPLARIDINRRILEGSLQVGMVPDFGSDAGGGMSWITADFLIQSMFFLSQRHVDPIPEARIHHIVSNVHIPYTEIGSFLGPSHNGAVMKTVRPEEWFAALRRRGNPEMTMQAEVLEKWRQAGWIPFGLEAKSTLEVLKKEIGLVPPMMSRDLLSSLVIGDQGF